MAWAKYGPIWTQLSLGSDQKVKNHVKLDVLVTVGVNNDGIVLVMGSFMNKLAVLSTKTKKPKKIAGFNGFLVSGIVSLVS